MIGMAGYGANNCSTNDAAPGEIPKFTMCSCSGMLVRYVVLRAKLECDLNSTLRICISFFSLPLFLQPSYTVTDARFFILRRTYTGLRQLPPILKSHFDSGNRTVVTSGSFYISSLFSSRLSRRLSKMVVYLNVSG